MTRVLTVIVLAGFAAGLASCAALSDDVYTGNEDVHEITSGSAFGVTIGMDRDEARTTLQQHWGTRLVSSSRCRAGRAWCKGASDEDDFQIASGLTGETLELFSRDGTIVRLAWYQNPLDF